MKTTRLALLLVVVSIAMLVGNQQSASSAFPTMPWPHETAVSIPDPRNLLKDSPASDKSLLWKAHLALYLVKHPDLNRQQVRIILEAISLSSPEFFTTSKETTAQKIKANQALELLKREAVRAFPKSAATSLFGNMMTEKAGEDILKMYFDLSALPVKKRRVSFRTLSSNDRSELWRTHLVLFLVKRPQLSEMQKDVILSAMSLATSEYFGVRSSDPAWKIKVREPSRLLEQQIVNAFTLEEATKIFATLGDDAELAKSSATVLLKSINYKPLSDSGPYMQWANNSISEQDLMVVGGCGCSTDSDYCSIWSSCVGGGCSGSESGCGTLWNHPCNGACK